MLLSSGGAACGTAVLEPRVMSVQRAKGIIRCLKYCVKVALGIEKAVNAKRAVRLRRGLGGFEVNTQSHD